MPDGRQGIVEEDRTLQAYQSVSRRIYVWARVLCASCTGPLPSLVIATQLN